MYIEQIYTNCLAEASYYVESNGEALVIDPIREYEPYIAKAKERNAKIRYVLETHFHADFVSGHIDLAKKTGATIIFGPKGETKYESHTAVDGEEIQLGDIRIKVLHTPGHTPESTCYLLYDENGKEHAVFTGDTLFVGAVGRPDLLDGKMTSEELAGLMYESLNNKLKPLLADVLVYPAHGPGSQCGKNLGTETWSSMGEQMKSNYALQEMTKEEFINEITCGINAPPPYFFKDAAINKNGYNSLDDTLSSNLKALSVDSIIKCQNEGALILDTRDPEQFSSGFIPNSVNIGLGGMYAIWVGTLIDINQPIIIVADPGKEKEAILRLARVGFENVSGYLDGGMQTWINAGNEIWTINNIEPGELEWKMKDNQVLDVRKEAETDEACIAGAQIYPLTELVMENGDKLNKDKQYLIYCRSGYRSMIASSFLRSHGFKNVTNVRGGFEEIKKTSIPINQPTPV